MADHVLAQAVEQWIAVTRGLSDTALEIEWVWRAHDEEGVRFAFFRTFEDLRTLAANTLAERVAHGPANSAAQQALAQYHGAWRELQAVLSCVEDGWLDQVPREGEWSLRRVLGHMFATPRMFFVQTMYGLREHRAGRTISAPMPQDEIEPFLGHTWEEYDQMMGGGLADILADYARLHERILSDLAEVTGAELDVVTRWWEGYDVPVQFRLHRFESHLRQHTIQIEKTLYWLGHPPTEAQRLNRLIGAALAECEGVRIGAPGFAAEMYAPVAAGISARAVEIAALVG